MARNLAQIAIASTFALLTSACGDGDGSSTETESESGETSGETGGETGGEATVAISGSVAVYPSASAIDDAEVCWVQDGVAEPCTSTDTGGQFTLEGVPTQSQGALRFVDDQIATFAYMLATGTEDLSIGSGFGIDAPEVHAAYFTQSGVTPMDGTAVVTAQLAPGLAGYTVALTPESGEGPFYYGATAGEIDPQATATGSFGVGLFLNVASADGPFELSFVEGDTSCALASSGESLQAWSIPEGVESVYLGVSCE